MRPHPSSSLLLAALAGVLLTGCAAEPVAKQVSAVFVTDRKVMTFVQAFNVHVFKSQTTSGQSVTCDDFPGRFNVTSSSLQLCFDDTQASLQAGCKAQVAWSGETTSADLKLRVPTDERLVIVARGIAQTDKGSHVVARGCASEQFSETGNQPLEIDVIATAGRTCFDNSDCEVGTSCNSTDPDLPGGYCSKWPCNSDIECKPGTVCVLDAKTGGLCARACDNTADCNGAGKAPQFYSCEKRQGPGGCQSVCIWQQWNTANACGS